MRFTEWLCGASLFLVINETSNWCQVMDLALMVKRDAKAVAGDPISKLIPHAVYNYAIAQTSKGQMLPPLSPEVAVSTSPPPTQVRLCQLAGYRFISLCICQLYVCGSYWCSVAITVTVVLLICVLVVLCWFMVLLRPATCTFYVGSGVSCVILELI